jgi:hypothetical protein
MVGQTVVVTITDKHWLLPWPIVEIRLWERVSYSLSRWTTPADGKAQEEAKAG